MDQTSERSEKIHPLALRFMDAVANMIDRRLRETPSDVNSPREAQRILERLRKVLGSDQ